MSQVTDGAGGMWGQKEPHIPLFGNTLQHTTTLCNTLRRTATHCTTSKCPKEPHIPLFGLSHESTECDEWVMSRRNQSCHVGMSHVTSIGVMSIRNKSRDIWRVHQHLLGPESWVIKIQAKIRDGLAKIFFFGACMCVSVCVYMWVCMCVCISMFGWVACVPVCLCASVPVRVSTCVCGYRCAFVYVCVCMSMCACVCDLT